MMVGVKEKCFACSLVVVYALLLHLQLFNRDAETAESWMAAREAFFSKESVGASLDRVETLIRKSEDFDKSVKAQVGSVFYKYILPYCMYVIDVM